MLYYTSDRHMIQERDVQIDAHVSVLWIMLGFSSRVKGGHVPRSGMQSRCQEANISFKTRSLSERPALAQPGAAGWMQDTPDEISWPLLYSRSD